MSLNWEEGKTPTLVQGEHADATQKGPEAKRSKSRPSCCMAIMLTTTPPCCPEAGSTHSGCN